MSQTVKVTGYLRIADDEATLSLFGYVNGFREGYLLETPLSSLEDLTVTEDDR